MAGKEVEKLLVDYAKAQGLVDDAQTEAAADEGNYLILKSGTRIRFGSEPDVECRNRRNELVCVVEIKGSADAAGAQTRLGETKKSFTKAKRENTRCVTVYLPSVMTRAVEEQLKTERDIDKIFSLPEICSDEGKRAEFLTELFRFILREKVQG